MDKDESTVPSSTQDEHQVEQLMGPQAKDLPADLQAAEAPVVKVSVAKDSAPTELHPEDPDFANPAVDAAVDDITHEESDAVLEAEDTKLAEAFTPKPSTVKERVKNFFWRWWHNKPARFTTLGLLAIALIFVGAYPTTRYFALNSVGVRVSASLEVSDAKTQQPLKNISVSVGGKTATTDEDGRVTINGLKQGKQKVVLSKRAFASVEFSVTLGWGTNPLKPVSLVPTGMRYTFVATNWLSGKPIPEIEAASGEASAIADEEGKIVLTLDPGEAKTVDVTIRGADQGYRDEKVTVAVDTKDIVKQPMVLKRPHFFISKRSGTYDLYQIDADGKNEKVALAGTGKERDDINLTANTDGSYLALVSTRDDQRNKEGFVLSGLFVLNVKDSLLPKKVVQSEQIQIVGWLSGRLVYVKVAEGTSAASPGRERIMSYDPATNENKELASGNYFNDVVIAGGKLYYAPSNAYGDNPQAFLFQVDASGTGKKTILDKETWNIFRTDYTTFTLSSAQQKWFTYTLGSNASPVSLSGAPSQQNNRLYIDGPQNQKAVWVDNRDGKGVLISYDQSKTEDTVLVTRSGIKYPTYWLNESTVVFRVKTPNESADYVVSTNGGEARKIQDVADTTGVDSWYYY